MRLGGGLVAEDGMRYRNIESAPTSTTELGALSKLLKLNDTTTTTLRRPESITLTQRNTSLGPAAVHVGGGGGAEAVEEDWVERLALAAFPVLLAALAAMLTFFMVQFCLNKGSLVKSAAAKKKAAAAAQSKEKLRDKYQVPAEVVVASAGAPPPVAGTQPGWARRSISAAARQCAIDMEESSNDSSGSSSGDENQKRAPKSLGSLRYRLSYDFASSVFSVSVLEARGLPGLDLCGTSDPYVKVFFQPDDGRQPVHKTKVKKRCLEPVFEETFQFSISYPQLVSKTLHLALYDFDRFSRHDEIGQVSVPMNTVELAELTERWQPLERLPGQKGHDKLGDLCLGLRYVPNSGKLTVTLAEARNLKKMDLAGLSDPFVKVSLYVNGKRMKKKKTEIKKCTLNPQFNESFSFEVSSEQIGGAQLRCTVIDYDRIGVSEPIGALVLGCEASGEPEARHWMDMLASPRRQITRWHPLKPHL